MKISNLWSIVAFVGLCLASTGVEAQSARDAEVLVPLSRGVVAMPAESAATYEGQVIEELPAVVASRSNVDHEALARQSAVPSAYWMGLLSLCIVAAGALSLRQLARHPKARISLPKPEGRISLV